MTLEELQAKYGSKPAPPTAPVVAQAGPVTPIAPPPAAYATSAPAQGGYPSQRAPYNPNGPRKAFPSNTKLPLVVKQSKKTGNFYLGYNISGSIEVDQAAFDYVKSTGNGIGEAQVGVLTIWPPFEKRTTSE